MEDQANYGKVTVGKGSFDQREIDVVEFVRSRYKGNRVISIAKLEDETLVMGVENPPSTGRAAQATIWLSQESVIGVISTAIIYFSAKGLDFQKLLSDSLDRDDIDIEYSDNMEQGLRDNGIIN